MKHLAWLFLLSSVLAVAFTAPTAEADDLRGLLTRVDGSVVLELAGAAGGEPDTDEIDSVQEVSARPLQVLDAGAVVRVAESAAATLVCSSDQVVELTGPTLWALTPSGCEGSGRAVPAGSFRSLLPVNASLQRFDGAFVRALPTRGDEDVTPVTVISPRGRYAGGMPNVITWLDRAGYAEFEIRVDDASGEAFRVSADEAGCRPSETFWPGESVRLCEVARRNPAPAPGESERIRILGRLADKRFFETDYGETQADRLREPQDSQIVTWREALSWAGLDGVSARWLDAAHSRRRSLSGDAVTVVRELWASDPDPGTALILGDLYVAADLGELGQAFYRLAGESDDTLLREGAEQRLAALDRLAAGGAP